MSKYVDRNGWTDSMNHTFTNTGLWVLDMGRCSISNTNRLIKLQERAAKIIFKGDLMTRSREMFSEFKWLPFLERVKYHTLVMMYNILIIWHHNT